MCYRSVNLFTLRYKRSERILLILTLRFIQRYSRISFPEFSSLFWSHSRTFSSFLIVQSLSHQHVTIFKIYYWSSEQWFSNENRWTGITHAKNQELRKLRNWVSIYCLVTAEWTITKRNKYLSFYEITLKKFCWCPQWKQIKKHNK